jgi:hypothetical protein
MQGIAMKALGLVIALGFLAANNVNAQQTPPKYNMGAPGQYEAMDLYGQADAFHDIVQVQHCDQIDAQAVDDITRRLVNARAALEARFGPMKLPPKQPLPSIITNQTCSSITIESYGHHVTELEQFLAKLGAH